jgi:formylglycine-generating enzyme required for sulfatase activity
VQAYGRAAQGLIERALGIEDDSVFTILEHELMHQETLLYMFHNLPYGEKVAREPFHRRLEAGGLAGWKPAILDIPRGRATLGADGTEFGWDNEFPALVVDVDEFAIDALNVTNADYLEFMEATGASHPYFWERSVDAWMWRGMFAPISLPLDWPVYVTHAEASAYAAWKGCRLPTEAEYHRAAFGTPSGEERLHPWGDEPPDHTRGNFDFQSWDPLPVGSFPRGASAWGVHDLTGNGWEWTSSVFAGFPGFTPMPSYPEYSADFFDGDHYVLKGASPSTPLELVRRSFRNWFRPSYPYVYAKFRCVR